MAASSLSDAECEFYLSEANWDVDAAVKEYNADAAFDKQQK
jgi:hypothetical protein